MLLRESACTSHDFSTIKEVIRHIEHRNKSTLDSCDDLLKSDSDNTILINRSNVISAIDGNIVVTLVSKPRRSTKKNSE